MAATLDKAEERDLLDGLGDAAHAAEDGLSANQAMAKVARDRGWKPGTLRAAVNAFNNGRQLAQWQAGGGVLDKLAAFDLADYDTIHASIWGSDKRAADDVFDRALQALPPRPMEPVGEWAAPFEKTAAAEPDYVVEHRRRLSWDKAAAQHDRATREFEEARRREAAAHDALGSCFAQLEGYFAKSAYDRLPFDDFEGVVRARHGAAGQALADYLAGRLPHEKRAGDRWVQRRPYRGEAPFQLAERTVNVAKEALDASHALTTAKQALEAADTALVPFFAKAASWATGAVGGAAAGGTRGILDQLMGSDALDKRVGKDVLDLEDPGHEDHLRSIQAQAMLTRMMADPANPLSGYDPEDVLTSYNELSQLTPRLATQPAAVQALLAKRLMGHSEPFEVKELTDIEKGLKQTQGGGASMDLGV